MGMGIAEHLWSQYALASGFHLNTYLVGVATPVGAHEVVLFIQSLADGHSMLDGGYIQDPYVSESCVRAELRQ